MMEECPLDLKEHFATSLASLTQIDKAFIETTRWVVFFLCHFLRGELAKLIRRGNLNCDNAEIYK